MVGSNCHVPFICYTSLFLFIFFILHFIAVFPLIMCVCGPSAPFSIHSFIHSKLEDGWWMVSIEKKINDMDDSSFTNISPAGTFLVSAVCVVPIDLYVCMEP